MCKMCVFAVQSHRCVQFFVTPWTAALPASLSITNSQSLLKFMSIELLMPVNNHILCHPLLLPPSVFPSIRVFSNESTLHIRWPKYWGFSFSISPSNEYPGLISFRMDWLDLLAVLDSQESSPTPQFNLWMWVGLSCFNSSGDGYVGEILELQQGCEGPFGSSRG